MFIVVALVPLPLRVCRAIMQSRGGYRKARGAADAGAIAVALQPARQRLAWRGTRLVSLREGVMAICAWVEGRADGAPR